MDGVCLSNLIRAQTSCYKGWGGGGELLGLLISWQWGNAAGFTRKFLRSVHGCTAQERVKERDRARVRERERNRV